MKKMKNSRGMAITEVLVAFLMLLISLVALYGCMVLSSNLIVKSADLDRKFADYQKEIAESGKDETQVFKDTIKYSFTCGTDAQYNFTISPNKAVIHLTGDYPELLTDIPVFS
ncbi:MAG: hypothetical protein LKM35_03645 [Lachnospiraceae bacterium]|jgi:hypothetical protein|nr:hypothetical protein [Lachnospiraceae bacterium]